MAAHNEGGRLTNSITSPEELNDYLRVTNPKVWLLLAAIVLLVVSLLAWSAAATVESYATGEARASGGEVTITFDDADAASKVRAGMQMEIGDDSVEILTVGTDEQGNAIASARARIPDGLYDARVGYNTVQVISMLFN